LRLLNNYPILIKLAYNEPSLVSPYEGDFVRHYADGTYTPEETAALEDRFSTENQLARQSGYAIHAPDEGSDSTVLGNFNPQAEYEKELEYLRSKPQNNQNNYSEGELQARAARRVFDRSSMGYGDLPVGLTNTDSSGKPVLDPHSGEYAQKLVAHMNDYYKPDSGFFGRMVNTYTPRFIRNIGNMDAWTANDVDTAKNTADWAAVGASFIPGAQPFAAAYHLGSGLGDMNLGYQEGRYSNHPWYTNAGNFAYDLGSTALKTGLSSIGMANNLRAAPQGAMGWGSNFSRNALNYTGMPFLGNATKAGLNYIGRPIASKLVDLRAAGILKQNANAAALAAGEATQAIPYFENLAANSHRYLQGLRNKAVNYGSNLLGRFSAGSNPQGLVGRGINAAEEGLNALGRSDVYGNLSHGIGSNTANHALEAAPGTIKAVTNTYGQDTSAENQPINTSAGQLTGPKKLKQINQQYRTY
jgi:hypothetical protein